MARDQNIADTDRMSWPSRQWWNCGGTRSECNFDYAAYTWWLRVQPRKGSDEGAPV